MSMHAAELYFADEAAWAQLAAAPIGDTAEDAFAWASEVEALFRAELSFGRVVGELSELIVADPSLDDDLLWLHLAEGSVLLPEQYLRAIGIARLEAAFA
jgi:hypothetical protein